MRVHILGLSLLLSLSSACNSPGTPTISSASGTGSGGASSGGSSTGGAADIVDGGIPEGGNAWAAGMAEALCGALFGCPNTILGAGAQFQDETACVAHETSFWLSTSIEPQPGEVTTASARLDQSQLCLGELVAFAEDAGPCAADVPFLIEYNQPQPASCMQGALAVAGMLSPGDPCVSPFQCSSRRCEQGSGCGVCGPPLPNLDGGSPCVEYDDCAPGLVCSAGRCRVFVPNGQSCGPADLAAADEAASTWICQAGFFLPGQACIDGSTTECEAQVCQNSMCSAVPIVPIGSMCGYSSELQGYRLCDPQSSVCDVVDTQAQAGYCIARKAIGERCFVSKGFDGDDCVGDTRCLGGRCESPFGACLSDGGISEAVADAGPIFLPDASGDYAAALAALEQAYAYVCEGVANCPALSADIDVFGGSAASCEAALLPDELATFNAPGLDPTSGLAAQTACNAELAQLSPCLAASTLITGYDSPGCPEATGTLPAGAACASTNQCASGNCSTYWTGSGCGVCGNVQDAGASCNAQSDCAGMLACAEGVCAPWGQFDAGCSPARSLCTPVRLCRRAVLGWFAGRRQL